MDLSNLKDNLRSVPTFRTIGDVRTQLKGDKLDEWIDDTSERIVFELMSTVRKKRDELLLASDRTQFADSSVDAKAWAVYRQALRDLPATITDPTEPIEWPEPPK